MYVIRAANAEFVCMLLVELVKYQSYAHNNVYLFFCVTKLVNDSSC